MLTIDPRRGLRSPPRRRASRSLGVALQARRVLPRPPPLRRSPRELRFRARTRTRARRKLPGKHVVAPIPRI